jgi:hypothetical protein
MSFYMRANIFTVLFILAFLDVVLWINVIAVEMGSAWAATPICMLFGWLVGSHFDRIIDVFMLLADKFEACVEPAKAEGNTK